MKSRIFLDQVMLQIKHYREQAGLNQMEIAEKLKIGGRSYQRYESAHSAPSIDLLFQMAEILNFELKDLFSPVEALQKIGEVKFYSAEERKDFIADSSMELTHLFKVMEMDSFKLTIKKNNIGPLKYEPAFQNCPSPLALSVPKSTILNKAAMSQLESSKLTIATSSFHDSPRNVGILWGALLHAHPQYFIMKTTITTKSGPKTLTTSNVFIPSCSHYFILRAPILASPKTGITTIV